MDKIIANNSLPQSDYLDLITSTLSSYEVKDISSDGKVTRSVVNDDYFLVNDVWNVTDIGKIPNFVGQFSKYKGTGRYVKFSTENHNIGLELKFVLYHKLFSDELSVASLFNGYRFMINQLVLFLNEKHSRLSSLLDLDVEKFEKQWIWWLNNKGVKTTRIIKNIKYGELEYKTPIVYFFRRVYEKLFNLTDTREEWVKDRWDIRVLNTNYGVRYNLSAETYYIDFTKIENVVFRQYFKKYIKTRLLGGGKFSWGSALKYLQHVPRFLNLISKFNPEWNDLKGLTRKHIEKYLEYLHHHAKNNLKQKNANPNRHISENLNCVYLFIKDTQRFDYSIAPEKPTIQFLYPEDYPNLGKKSDDDIDYITDHVLEQLFDNINDLHPDVQPIVWVSYRTGLRISDVLGLTQGCLIRLNGKYSIKTDIEKTYVKGHTIPIDDQLADIIAVLIHNSLELSNEDNNPDKLIFVRYSGRRKGKPFSQHWVRTELNKLALQKNITDEMGNVFHFKSHQFRHTYAVKMLNGGADILTVQELLAHASPEMTMRYARLLDDTKRKEFEMVVKQGVFSFDLNGEIHQVSEVKDIPEDIMDMMWKDEKLNALDNPYGTCRARVNGNCPLAAEPPCLTANDGKPCFDLAVGMTSFDVKKYELLIETTTKWIEASKEYGREDMVKANEKNLERYQNIYETIKGGNVIFGRFDRMKRQLERKKKKGVKHV
ncbi:tyrosine-type recombinase/integrase [Bacillus sp. REN16]|uniref:tyrosine-type recombinase/integrase n=1 Tax=Bacillus sp. REN16 TaxID=2887296 RepID=UPI001E610440|nr:tyrosine-type recombinase/integrase [Bacillus sp. REN16]MCC3359304.1 tyrosine-type recombinase/integrase [Bacillus sp. REN16]